MLDVNPETNSEVSASPDKLFSPRLLVANDLSAERSPSRPPELFIPPPSTAVASGSRSSGINRRSQPSIPVRRATTGHASVRNSDINSPYSPSFQKRLAASWKMDDLGGGWSSLNSGLSKGLYGFPLTKHKHKDKPKQNHHQAKANRQMSPPRQEDNYKQEMRRREIGWSTSFPAEYHLRYASKRDLRETLAWQENQLRKYQQHDLRRLPADIATGNGSGDGLGGNGSTSPMRSPKFRASPGRRSNMDSDQSQSPSPSPSQYYRMERGSRSEVQVMKSILQREALLDKLRVVAQRINSNNGKMQVEEGNRLLNLLLETRNASVEVVESIATWQEANGKVQFYYWSRKNYMVQMVTDLNFLAQVKSLSETLHVNGESLMNNPFMMPKSITLSDLDAQKGAQKPIFQGNLNGGTTTTETGSPARNSERAKYSQAFLLWCLANLEDNAQEQLEQSYLSSDNQVYQHQQPSSPHSHKKKQKSPPRPHRSPGAGAGGGGGGGGGDWHARAEYQLRLLSMPMESSTGISHVVDSSQILKRKGFLPSLALSPPKTLTELMDNVKLTERKIGSNLGANARNLPKKLPPFEPGNDPNRPVQCNSSSDVFSVADGQYKVTSDDLEQLAQLADTPPKSVSLVAATVLILLSPGESIPKEISWLTARKMFVDGKKLIERLNVMRSQAQEIANFKLQALRPFLSNDKFVPKVVEQDSSTAAALCAWVHEVLALSQPGKTLELDGMASQHQPQQQQQQQQEDEEPCVTKTALKTSRDDQNTLLECLEDPLATHASVGIGVGDSLDQVSNQHRKLLLLSRTWSHHNISYFVSFFYERHGLVDTLSIKMYEPMSSVESLVYMTQQDLAQDFGPEALNMFCRRDFGSLCELIMSNFNSIMGISDENDPKASSSVYAATAMVLSGGPQAKDTAALAIQCAARQRLARNKVQTLRDVKHQTSSTKTQSIATHQPPKQALPEKSAPNTDATPAKPLSPIASTQSLATKMALAMSSSSTPTPSTSPSRPNAINAPRPFSVKLDSRPETGASSYASDFEADG